MKNLIGFLIIVLLAQSCSYKVDYCRDKKKLPKSRIKMIKKLNRMYDYKPYKLIK